MVKFQPKTKEELKELVDNLEINLGDIDTSLITDMSYLFRGSGRKDFSGIANWDVSNVTNMSGMFFNCKDFNEPLNSWDVSNVVNMNFMFKGCVNFNQPLDKWNVSNVKNMDGMFWGADKFNCDISNWDVSNVENFSGMFMSAKSFN